MEGVGFAWIAWIALGSALGGMARLLISTLIGRWAGEAFPWGTMAVNVSGAFAIGVLSASGALAAGPHADAWSFAAIGLLGSYTTVSSVSIQTLSFARNGEWRFASANVVLTVALCLAAVAAGLASGVALFRGVP